MKYLSLARFRSYRYSFYNNEPERNDGMESDLRSVRLAFAREPIHRAPEPWLASYPVFQDALGSGETTFRALPDYAKSVALGRTSTDFVEQATAAAILDEVRVSFVELCTKSVSDAVDEYLGKLKGERAVVVDSVEESRPDLVGHISNIALPLIARPPCLLRPGRHMFVDSWMRFFSYCKRGDLTIPLLAIDWLDFHDRLGVLRPRSAI
ncbi:hypothetical protein [Paraburkholderia hospita]|uniref:hypothetical protein n=1 Tax=Paraburkholderia hospita TaxID=169430 RepID=UPI0010556724|nr:hypothetical protein [Paraburkholderia hospita]